MWAPDSTSSSGSTLSISKVDIGILTIRDDEFRAVLDVFPQKAGVGVHSGTSRQYILRYAEIATGERYTVAILRQVEQGAGEAQHAARDLIEDVAPKLVLVVGIAGGLPSEDITLGDVVIGTRIHDYTVEAIKTGHETTYAATGGPIGRAMAAVVATLAGREDDLGDWTSGLPLRPTVTWTKKGQIFGPLKWRRELRAKLEHHFGGSSPRSAPIYVSGPIASSDRLVKDPKLLFPWITTARNLIAIEMESCGVYRAAQERCPMLPIRGISDIVGLRRADAWTKFACAAAAAFTRAFLRTRPISVDTPSFRVADCTTIDMALSSRAVQKHPTIKAATIKASTEQRSAFSQNDPAMDGVGAIASAEKVRCVIVLQGKKADFSADKLARAVETLRQWTGDITLQIIDIEEGSIRLVVTLSSDAAKTLLELKGSGQATKLCGFKVLDITGSQAPQAAAGAVIPLARIAQHHTAQFYDGKYAQLGSFAVGMAPTESVALDWVRGHDLYRGIVHSPTEQPPKSRVDHAAEESVLAFMRRGAHSKAIQILTASYGAPILAFALRIVEDSDTAKDIRQQVFIDAYLRIDQFEGRGSLWSWLCGIAYHRCLEELRRARRLATKSLYVKGSNVSDEALRVLDSVIDQDRVTAQRALEDCLGKLGPSMRTLVLMRCYLGMTYTEISELVGASPGTVQVRISRLLPRLRRCLREKGIT